MDTELIYASGYSDRLNIQQLNNDDIFFISQFFIHPNPERQKEIKFCLKKNTQLNIFKKIILLNERVYTQDELGLNNVEMENIKQVNINKRLRYSDVFNFVKNIGFNCYIAFGNSDIFFDTSLLNLRKSCLSNTKAVYSLTRYEYDPNEKKSVELFAHPECSQDTWIYHTSQLNNTPELLKLSAFNFGRLGCDNRIAYVLHSCGYKNINAPYIIKTYHYHTSMERNYTEDNKILGPYLLVHVVFPPPPSKSNRFSMKIS